MNIAVEPVPAGTSSLDGAVDGAVRGVKLGCPDYNGSCFPDRVAQRIGKENIRMTEHEWDVAKKNQHNYVLAIVSNLNSQGNETVSLIRDPYQKMQNNASKKMQLQITYSISQNILLQNISNDENWF